jgi:hypothetical protein
VIWRPVMAQQAASGESAPSLWQCEQVLHLGSLVSVFVMATSVEQVSTHYKAANKKSGGFTPAVAVLGV